MTTAVRLHDLAGRLARLTVAAAIAGGLAMAAASGSAAQTRAEARDSKDAPAKGGQQSPGANGPNAGGPKAGGPKAGGPEAGGPKGDGPKGGNRAAQGGPGSGPPGGPAGRPRGMFVGVDAVRKGPIQQTTPVIGRIVSQETGVVAARTPGPVEEMKVKVGDRVKKGDVIAVLVTDIIKAQLALQRAELQLARQRVARLEQLRTTSSAAFQRALYDDRVQEVVRAEANLRIAELALKYSQILAPFDGVVTQLHTDAGAYLPVGGQVVTLINDRNLEIEVDVPADRIGGLLPGTEVRFETAGGRKYTGKVRAIVPEQKTLTRTLAVRVTPNFNDDDAHRAINQSVTVAVPVGQPRDVVSVHKDGVIARGDGYMVFVVTNGRAMPRPVTIGEAIGSRYVVERGLAPGDIVIVRGNERVQPGMPVVFRKGS